MGYFLLIPFVIIFIIENSIAVSLNGNPLENSATLYFDKNANPDEIDAHLKDIDQVCQDPKPIEISNESRIEEGNKREKRLVLSSTAIFWLSQVIAVLTCQIANDWIFSDMYKDFEKCAETISFRNFFTGIKQCWNSIRLRGKKWRKILGSYFMVELMKMAGTALKQFQGHYRLAMLEIQKEFNELLLHGDQAVRVVKMIRQAELPLPDLDWIPMAQQETRNSPEFISNQILALDLHVSSHKFQEIFHANVKMLQLLRHHFTLTMMQIENNEAKISLPPQSFFHIRDEFNDVQIKWDVLREKGVERDGFAGKFIEKFVTWINGHPTTQANQLFLHSILILYMSVFDKSSKQSNETNETMSEINLVGDERFNEIGRCLLQSSLDEREFGKLAGKYATHKTDHNNNVIFEEIRVEIQQHALDMNLKYSEDLTKLDSFNVFASYLKTSYEEIFIRNDPAHSHAHLSNPETSGHNEAVECQIWAKQILVATNGINVVLTEKREVRLTVEKFEANEAGSTEILKEIATKIEKNFFTTTSEQAIAEANQNLASLNNFHINTKFAVLAHVISTDLWENRKKLQHLIQMAKQNEHSAHLEELARMEWLDINEAVPKRFRTVAKKLLDECYEEVTKVKEASHLKKKSDATMDAIKELLNNFVANKFEKSPEINRENALNEMVQETINWFQTTLIEVAGGDNLSETSVDQRMVMPRITDTLVQGMLKDVEYKITTAGNDNIEGANIPIPMREIVGPSNQTSSSSSRKKRAIHPLLLATITGLITGTVGNVLSEHIDVNHTHQNFFFKFKRKIVWTKEFRREQKERYISSFLQRSLQIIWQKLREADKSGLHLQTLVDKMSNFLTQSVRAESIAGAQHLTVANILIKLDILSSDNFEKHVEDLVASDQPPKVKLQVLEHFSQQNWIGKLFCQTNFKKIFKK